MTRLALRLSLFLVLLSAFFSHLPPTEIIGHASSPSSSPGFAAGARRSVQGEQSLVLREVRVPDVLDLPIIQQPADDPYYVSNRYGEVTEFAMARRYGNIGLLAHNTLSGKHFSKLSIGQEVQVVYGDGRTEYFVIAEILRFQALEPNSVSSSFRNLDREETLSAGDLFSRAYTGERRLVFQTCIEVNGELSWGRLFVIAVPRG